MKIKFYFIIIFFFLNLILPPLVFAINFSECPKDNTYIYEDTTFAPGLFCNVEDSLNRDSYKKQVGVLIITSDNVILDCNFMTLNGTGINGTFEDKFRFGIFNDGYNNVTVKNCIVQYYGDGILFINSTYSKIFNNTVRYNDNGIVLDNTYPSYVEKFQRKIPQSPAESFSEVFNNTAISNGHNYLLLYSNGNKIFNNYAFNNSHGLELENSSNNKIFRNNLYQDRIYLRDDSANNEIFENLIFNTSFDSIIFENSSYNYIHDNDIIYGRNGISFSADSKNNMVSDNNFLYLEKNISGENSSYIIIKGSEENSSYIIEGNEKGLEQFKKEENLTTLLLDNWSSVVLLVLLVFIVVLLIFKYIYLK